MRIREPRFMRRVIHYLAGKKVGDRKPAGKNKAASIELHFVGAAEGNVDDTAADGTTGPIPQGQPIVHAIARADGQLRPVTAATFDVLITLSEEPRKDGFKKDHIDAAQMQPLAIRLSWIRWTAAAQDDATDGAMKSSGRDGNALPLHRHAYAEV